MLICDFVVFVDFDFVMFFSVQSLEVLGPSVGKWKLKSELTMKEK